MKFKKIFVRKVNEVLERCECTEIKQHDQGEYWISAKHPRRGTLHIILKEKNSSFHIHAGPVGYSEEVKAIFMGHVLDKVVEELERWLS